MSGASASCRARTARARDERLGAHASAWTGARAAHARDEPLALSPNPETPCFLRSGCSFAAHLQPEAFARAPRRSRAPQRSARTFSPPSAGTLIGHPPVG